jgi:hypothetical protein
MHSLCSYLWMAFYSDLSQDLESEKPSSYLLLLEWFCFDYIVKRVGEFKTTFSQFHVIVLRLVGIKVHDDMLSNAMMWREVDVVASKGKDLAGVGV